MEDKKPTHYIMQYDVQMKNRKPLPISTLAPLLRLANNYVVAIFKIYPYEKNS